MFLAAGLLKFMEGEKETMKKLSIAVLIVLVFALSGCGKSSTIKIVSEEKTYPESDTVASNLEEAGYTVERSEEFEGLDVKTDRIKAVNGDEYIDICYNVSSMTDMDKIIEYYMDHYEKYNLVSGTEVVFCYSDDAAVESAGLQQ